MTDAEAARIVRADDLEPSWTVKQAKEPGFLRSLITWVGGPEGHINTNPGVAVETERCVTGLMRMPPGNRQAGVHVHSVAEIYVILKGRCESFDGEGRRHLAGPLDCLYIPAGVPHGVRTVGDDELELVWVHDAIERWGVSTYLDGPGPFPADDEVRLIAFDALEPRWTEARATEVGFLRWSVNWVAGQGDVDLNPGVAETNARLSLGSTMVQPWNRRPSPVLEGAETLVILSGRAIAEIGGTRHPLGRLDAIHRPAGRDLALRSASDEPLHLLWVRESADAAGRGAPAVRATAGTG